MTEVHSKLGKMLHDERERRGLALVDLSNDLKIAERHLIAIEEGDLTALPGPLYFGLFAKSYAEALGIDYVRSLEAIKEELGEPIDSPIEQVSDDVAARPQAPVPGRKPKAAPATPAEQPNGRSMTSWIIIAVLLIALVVVAWVLFRTDGKFSLKNLTHHETEVAADSERGDGSSDYSQDFGKAGKKGEKAALNLQMVAHDRTWAVVLADGDTVLQTNLKPWREYNIGAQDKLVVSVGTPLAVEMKLNGLPVDLSDPEKGDVSSVTVTPENMSMFVRETPSIDSGTIDTVPGDSTVKSDSIRRHPASPVDTVTRRDTLHAQPARPRDSLRAKDTTALRKSPTSKPGGKNGT